MTTPQQSIQAQVNEVTQFATGLVGIMFLLLIGKTIGGMEKNFVNSLLNVATPESLPVRIPQTKIVTVKCSVCGKVIEIHEYNAVTRSEALRRHIEKEHTSRVGLHPHALMIEGGEPVPRQYRDLVSLISEPLPEYSLLTLLPAVEPEVGEKKIDAVLRQLKSGVESIQDSYQFRLFLTTMAKFHDYSIGNQILIMLQMPDATRVAGFNTWKDLGRWVKKGGRGIAILAPVMPRKPKKEEVEDEEEEEIVLSPVHFIVVHVFDLSQTEGKPLPEFEIPVLTGAVNDELFARLLDLMKAHGVRVSFEPRPHMDPEIKGQYIHGEIWVRPEEPRAQQLKTLVHEIAHYYSEGVFHIPRRDAETIAESAAYVVGAHYGFDTGVRSFPYVALWAQDKKVLDQNLNSIRQVATTILDELEKMK